MKVSTNLPGLVWLVAMLGTSAVLADDYGEPDLAQFPAAADWAFARGQWEVTTWYRNEEGELTQTERKAEVTLRYLDDGITVQSTFRIGDDFFSTQVRTYDTERQKWISHFVNSKRQRQASTESRRVGDEMITLNVQGYSGSDAFMSREVDSEITENRFVKTIRRSDDLGGTWGPVVFRMVFERRQ